MSLLTGQNNFMFLSSRPYQKTPTSKVIQFVELALTDKFEKVTLIADDQCNLNIQPNTQVSVVLSLSNYNNRTSTTLLQMNPAK